MTGAEHLAWCKTRALAYADRGDAGGAVSSLMQDLAAHPDTAGSVSIVRDLMFPLVLTGHLNTPAEIREFVEGFN